LKTIPTQAHSQILRIGGSNAFLRARFFVFIIFLKETFLSTTKFGKAEIFGRALFSNAPRGYGPTPTFQPTNSRLSSERMARTEKL